MNSSNTPAHTPAAAPDPLPDKFTATGTFRPHPRGFGFIDVDTLDGTPIEAGTSIFVPPPAARGLVADDHVQAKASVDDRGASTDRVTVKHRRRTLLVGTVGTRRGKPVFEPHPTLASDEFRPLPKIRQQLRQLRNNSVVVVKLDADPDLQACTSIVAGPFQHHTPEAIRAITTIRSYGALQHPDGNQRFTEAWLAHVASGGNGLLHNTFDETNGTVPGRNLERHDLTDVTTITVDDATTRDLDDAISAEQVDNDTIRIRVHIADVAATVTEGSDLDKAARSLAATLYLASGTAPMLPRNLSENSLSLLPGQHRNTITVTFDVHRDGSHTHVDLQTSRTVSDARITYEHIQQHLDGNNPDRTEGVFHNNTVDSVWATVDAAATASRWLAADRNNRSTFEELFTNAQQHVVLRDGTAQLVDVPNHPDAQNLVERLMVATNERVAEFLTSKNLPGVFRTHQGIDPEDVTTLDHALDAAGITVGQYDAETLTDIIGDVGGGDAATIAAATTGAMARATYQPTPDPHTGLAAHPYCHFTSPIRRYADLAVHRIVRAALADETTAAVEDLQDLCVWLDERAGATNRAEALERAHLAGVALQQQLHNGGVHGDAVVQRVTPAGLSVRVNRLGVTGFIPADELGQRRLDLKDGRIGTADGSWTLGDRTRVKLTEVDQDGRLTFTPAA